MLITFIIVAAICWLLGFFVNGFCVYNIALIIPTIMFAVRKIGIHIKFSNICTCEGLFLFASIVFRCIFGSFRWIPLLLGILLRVIFLGVVLYDDTVYVYVSEERKKV